MSGPAPRRLAVVVLAVVVAGLGVGSGRAGAETVDELLDRVAIDSERHERAVAALADAEQAIRDADATVARIEPFLAELRQAESLLAGSLPDLEARVVATDLATAAAQEDLRDVAVAAFVGGGPAASIASLLAGSVEATERVQRMRLIDVVGDERLAELALRRRQHDDAVFARDTAVRDLATLRTRIATEEATLAAARSARQEGDAALPARRDEIVAARRVAQVAGTDFPVYVLAAYARAAAGQDGCNLHWSVLAGIGKVESRHGTFRGATVAEDGDVSPAIIGIALDGTRSREILDTDGGALDGDTVFDRAVGPMQFIPSTWAGWARDGNGDGVIDPQNLYDAAAAAAAYLCRVGDLSDADTLRRALFSYNRSEPYGDAVLRHAGAYAGAVG